VTATPRSRSRVSFASLSGLRCGRMMMLVPSWTILVCAAREGECPYRVGQRMLRRMSQVGPLTDIGPCDRYVCFSSVSGYVRKVPGADL
jgi:hypothetical protein